MSVQPAYKSVGSQTAKLLQFPAGTTSGSTNNAAFPDYLIEEIFDNPVFEEKIKTMVEGSLSELMIRRFTSESISSDNPFGSIYLSELLPDEINTKNAAELNRLSNIKDLSNEIQFNDGWDD